MTKQEIFNTVVRGLAKQNWEQSIDHTGECQYRGPNNLRCAAGWLIPDDEYDISFEGKEASTPEVSQCLANLGYSDEQIRFIGDLQASHDVSCNGDKMRRAFKYFASNRGLLWPEDVP